MSSNGEQLTEANISMENRILYECYICSATIRDELVLKVDEYHFHSSCLNCSECRIKLFDACYIRDGLVLCKQDFIKKFGRKCSSCGYGFPTSDSIQRINDFTYHLQCFVCLICHRQLIEGDEFYLINNQKLICKNDHDKLKAKEFEDINKRPRTTISQEKLEILKKAYNISSKPPRLVRESLANETGLDMRVVQVWFQNRRAKEKRLKKDLPKSMNKTKTNENKGKSHQTIRMNTTIKHSFYPDEDTSMSCDDLLDYDSKDSFSDDSQTKDKTKILNDVPSSIHSYIFRSNEQIDMASQQPSMLNLRYRHHYYNN